MAATEDTIGDPLGLLEALVRAETVTPDGGPALDVLEARLARSGFSVDRPVFSQAGTADVENLFAAAGAGGKHMTFLGHVDVVPTGDTAAWSHPPFAAEIADGMLYGRGAIDMKSGIAAMVAAFERFAARRGGDFGGRFSLVITSDEEGVAVNGTVKLLDWAAKRGERFTAAMVGEPSSAATVGDQIKIGRRGSWQATITVTGTQGHSAYPDRADNPLRGLVTLLAALMERPLDAGSEHFAPSTLEVVSADVGNPAWNVIPATARARINSRFNDCWSAATLEAEIRARLAAAAEDQRFRPGAAAPVAWRLDAEPTNAHVFLTSDEALISLVRDAMQTVTGIRPVLSTGGGTSDARFVKDYCPVVELGLVGATLHEIDERVPLADLETQTRIYEAVLDAYFGG